MTSWHKGKYAYSAYGATREGLIYEVAGGWRGEVLDPARNGFVLHSDVYRDLAAAKKDIGARLEIDRRIAAGHGRTRGSGSGSIKARWAEVRRLEASGHALKHPRAFVFGLERRKR